ncbi:MAG: Holliday junction resolvase RuvX [Deltaproteobacteria bacterium]|nr:Holliday junction resolvase RuvX [Deltaproteobacteria bacterium]
MSVPGRILALDVGEKRIGLAVSDPLRLIAHPQGVVENRGRKTLTTIAQCAIEAQATIILIGMPYELDGSIGEQGKKVILFRDALVKRLQAERELMKTVVELWDERFTSEGAEHYIAGTGARSAERRGLRDSVAASLILESYLQSLPPASAT